MNLLASVRAAETALEDGVKTVEGWAAAIYDRLDPPLRAAVDVEVGLVKGAVVAAARHADSALKPALDVASTAIEAAVPQIAAAAGYALAGTAGAAEAVAVEGELHPYMVAGLDELRDAAKAEIDAQFLALKARLAGASVEPAPEQPAPQA